MKKRTNKILLITFVIVLAINVILVCTAIHKYNKYVREESSCNFSTEQIISTNL